MNKNDVYHNTMNGIIMCILCILFAVLTVESTFSATPDSGIEFGFQHRVRFVDFDNLLDYSDTLDDHNQFYRFRSRLWARLIRDNLEIKLQMANEFRHYNQPDKDHSYDEIYVDECYLRVDELFGSAWSVAIGRQNIMKGDGFMFFDGSPLDGSRSSYFNSIILKRSFTTYSLEFFGISNPAVDQYFPRINDQAKPLIEQDESAFGLFLTNRRSSGALFEATYFFKQEESPYTSSAPQYRADRSLHIAGGRVSLPAGPGTFTCEIGAQHGEEDPDRTVSAWAGHLTWRRPINLSMKPVMKVSAAAFSADDPETDKDEGWTPPFARWPQFSELYIYSFVRERGVASCSNLWFANVACEFSPAKSVKFLLSYYNLNAFESNELSGSIFGKGKNRGDLFQIRTDLKLLQGLTGHILYEYLRPGDFYADDAAGHFLRFELQYQFSHFLSFS